MCQHSSCINNRNYVMMIVANKSFSRRLQHYVVVFAKKNFNISKIEYCFIISEKLFALVFCMTGTNMTGPVMN